MIVILRPEADEEQVRELRERVRAAGLDTAVSPGSARDVVLVLGETRGTGLESSLVGHPAVERVVPVLPRRRYERLFSRRSFLDVLLAVLAGTLAALGAVGAALFLGRSGEERRKRSILRVGTLADFDRRAHRLVEHEGRLILVLRSATGDFHALSAVCTHSEVCQVEWSPDRQQLQCPCHAAAFDVFGNVLRGPPPRPLRAWPVEVIGDAVFLKPEA